MIPPEEVEEKNRLTAAHKQQIHVTPSKFPSYIGGALQRGRPDRSGMEMQFAAVLHFSLGDLYSGVCSAFVWLLLLPNNTAPESRS